MVDRLDALKGPGQLTEWESKYPVTKLWGDWLAIVATDETGKDGSEYTQVKLQLANIEVVEKTGDYAHPNYEIAITYKDTASSKYGVFVQSAAAAVEADTSGGIGLKQLFKDNFEGRRCLFEYKKIPMYGKDPVDGQMKKDVPTPVWHVLEVEGVGQSGETVDEAIARIKGECTSAQDFIQKAIATPVLQSEVDRIQEEAKTIGG